MKLRALISVILGCDVCPSGVKNIGPSKVDKKMTEIRASSGNDKEVLFNQLMDYAIVMSKPKMSSPPQFDKEVLTTFINAIVYQPTNEQPVEVGVEECRTYLMPQPPENLPKYLEEFKADATLTDKGPGIPQCKGSYTNSLHSFLAAVTHHSCAGCDETVCCVCSASIDKKEYCLSCYIVESILPGGEEVSSLMNISAMRDELKVKCNFDRVEMLSIKEVEEAWDAHALHRSIKELAESVNFPVTLLWQSQAVISGMNLPRSI